MNQSTTPVSGLVRTYQILATVVGINLLFVIFAAVAKPLTDDTSWWNRNKDLIFAIDQIHGVLFMGLLVVIAMLASRYRWRPAMTISTMLLATIPFVSFWAERRATRALTAG